MHQAGELPKTLRVSKIHYEPPQKVCKAPFASIFPPSMENGDGTRWGQPVVSQRRPVVPLQFRIGTRREPSAVGRLQELSRR